MARAGAEPSGELRIVAPTNFGLTMIGPAISEFLLAYRDISVDLSLNDQLIDPIDGGYDIAIRVIVSQLPDTSSLRAARLTTSRRILCAAPEYLSRRGLPKRPEDLADHECLSYSYFDDPRLWRLEGADGAHVVRVSGRIVTSAGQVLRTAAARGLGIASGPTVFFREELDSGAVVRVLPDGELPQATIYALYPVSRRPPPKVAAFNAFMQKFLAGRFR